jgi:hypothetical protein
MASPASPRGDSEPACPNLPLPKDQALGVADYVLVAPGDLFRDQAQLTTPRPGRDDVDTWTVVGQSSLLIGKSQLDVYNIEQTGNGSALVFVDVSRADAPRVLATYANAFGGNGSHLAIVDTWQRTDCPMAVIVVEESDEYRGFYGVPGDESSRVEAETEQTFTALGVSPQGIWQASEVLVGSVHLTVQDGWPRLKLSGVAPRVLRFERQSLRFAATTEGEP